MSLKAFDSRVPPIFDESNPNRALWNAEKYIQERLGFKDKLKLLLLHNHIEIIDEDKLMDAISRYEHETNEPTDSLMYHEIPDYIMRIEKWLGDKRDGNKD